MFPCPAPKPHPHCFNGLTSRDPKPYKPGDACFLGCQDVLNGCCFPPLKEWNQSSVTHIQGPVLGRTVHRSLAGLPEIGSRRVCWNTALRRYMAKLGQKIVGCSHDTFDPIVELERSFCFRRSLATSCCLFSRYQLRPVDVVVSSSRNARLATACFKGKTGTVEIVRAKRVERLSLNLVGPEAFGNLHRAATSLATCSAVMGVRLALELLSLGVLVGVRG